MFIGNKEFVLGRKPYIMGILNVTPDSFSDGGEFSDIDKALRHVKEMIDSGADIIDVGGESTRPGYAKISVGEEIYRTCFVIEAIKEHFNIPVSLDTYKSQVAEAGILAGADMINDIWGLRYDDGMAGLIARHRVACCLMHNRSNNQYNNFVEEVVSELEESVDMAVEAGVDRGKLIVDPGIGFGKDLEQNLILMNKLDRLQTLGLPVLLGTSRKSMIGNVLNLPVEDRLEGTLATSVLGLMKGVSFFRVHDVTENYRALKMAWTILNS